MDTRQEARLFSLEGKVAIVTGASGTVGRAISISLATAGANLVLNYFSNEAGVKETQKLVEKLGAETVLVTRRRWRCRDCAEVRRRSAGEVGQAGHPREQRRPHRRQPAHPHVRRRMGQRHRGQPAQHLPVHPRSHAADAASALRTHHHDHRASMVSSATRARRTTRPRRPGRSASRARSPARSPAAASR